MRLWIALLGMISLSAHGGNELGNGGDSFAQEFTALGRKVARAVAEARLPNAEDRRALVAAVEAARVSSAERLYLRGAEVDAINYPARKKISLSRSRWAELSPNRKASLVLHEYLGVAGIDDSSYQISSAFLEVPAVALPEDYRAEEPIRHFAGAPVPGEASAVESFSAVEGNSGLTGNRWGFGVGSGFGWFGGNMGKLYGESGLPLELRASYLLAPEWNLRLAYASTAFYFTSVETGLSTADLASVSGALEYHLGQTRQWNRQGGFDPYVAALLGSVFRTTRFAALGGQEAKDQAMVAQVLVGLNYLIGSQIGISLEGRYGSIFFKDRFDQTYYASGLENTTGAYYAANVGVQYYF